MTKPPHPPAPHHIRPLHPHLFPHEVPPHLARPNPDPPPDAKLLIQELDAVPPADRLDGLAREQVLQVFGGGKGPRGDVGDAGEEAGVVDWGCGEGVAHPGGGGGHQGRVEGGVAQEAHGAGVVAAELAQLDQECVDALDAAREHDLVLAVDVGDQDLFDWGDVAGGVVARARRGVAEEVVNGGDEGGEAVGLADEGHHAVFAAFRGGGFTAAAGHDLGAATDHFERVGVVEVFCGDEGGEFA